MSRTKLGLVFAAVIAAAAVVFVAIGLVPRDAERSKAQRPVSPEEQRRAEERLLDETTFSHPVSAAAPDVSVVTADGKRTKLGDHRGKILFVNFWATWCPPCVEEMPSMLKLGSDLSATHPGSFEMVAVSGDDTWDAVQQYFTKNFGGIPKALTVVRDPDAVAARAYYCAARGYCPDVKFPETYIVDRSGRIVAMIVGPRNWSDPAARQWLEFLIQG
jgi:thiol-disulfide isomerase/thioredoxin